MVRATFGIALLAFVITMTGAGAPLAQPELVKLEVAGTAFRATFSDGEVRQGTQLAGAVLVFEVDGRPMRVRLAAITPDPADQTGRLLLYDLRIADDGKPFCRPDPDGRQLGFPLAGRTAPDGRFIDAGPGTFELICTSGAQGKCVRLGYRPWENAPDGRPMRDYYDACVRLIRADYCGDTRSWTRDGTSVDLWDRLGIQKSDTGNDPAFGFEAGWRPDGAACVHRMRVNQAITYDKLKGLCPRLAAIPSCDEASAREAGALLFNRSRE